MMSSILRLISRRVAPPARRRLLLSPPAKSFSTVAHRELLRRPSSPWLMLPPYFVKGGSDMVYNFYSPINGKVVSFNNSGGKEETELMRDELTTLIGSSHGWLALFNSGSSRMILSNPISGRRIELPPVTGEPIRLKVDTWCPRKVILSSSPEEKDCRAVVILGSTNRVAFCSPGRGDAGWTPLGKWKRTIYVINKLKYYRYSNGLAYYRDIVHSPAPETFFASSVSDCCWQEDLEGWDITDPVVGPRTVRLDRLGKDDRDSEMRCRSNTYLVPTDDDRPFIVRAYFSPEAGTIDDFDVFRVGDGGVGRELCSSLGDLAMFVGINHSFAVKASEYPGLKPNCIYFSDCGRHYRTNHDDDGQFIGIFDYKTKTATPLYYDSIKLEDSTPQPWFTPTLD